MCLPPPLGPISFILCSCWQIVLKNNNFYAPNSRVGPLQLGNPRSATGTTKTGQQTFAIILYFLHQLISIRSWKFQIRNLMMKSKFLGLSRTRKIKLVFISIIKAIWSFFFCSALHSVRLFTHEDSPVIEGHLLTLACKAKGPASLKFMWWKDGAAVRTDRTSRNMWETRIVSDDGVTQLSFLDISCAEPYDEGITSDKS